MHERLIYHVIPNNGKWTVTKEGHDEPLADFDSKDEAVRFGTAEAQELGLGELRIHAEDNSVEREVSFSGRGDRLEL
jgi:hypothetical protein